MRVLIALALMEGAPAIGCDASSLAGQWLFGFPGTQKICSVPLQSGKGSGTCSTFQKDNLVTAEESLALELTVRPDCLVEGVANGNQVWGTLDAAKQIVNGGIANIGAFIMTRH